MFNGPGDSTYYVELENNHLNGQETMAGYFFFFLLLTGLSYTLTLAGKS